MDSIILSSLLREKKAHNFDGVVIPVEFLYEAEATLEEDIGVRVNRDDIYNRLLFLERRYRSFKGLVEHAGTRWDKPSNKVFASEKTWAALLKVLLLTFEFEPSHSRMYNFFSYVSCHLFRLLNFLEHILLMANSNTSKCK